MTVESLLPGEVQGQVPASLWSYFHRLINTWHHKHWGNGDVYWWALYVGSTSHAPV